MTRRHSGVLSLVLLLVACGSSDGTLTAPGEPATIQVNTQALSLPQKGAAQLTAKVVDAQGTELAGRPLTFTSESSDLVTVTSAGLVVSVGPAGSAVVKVASGSLEASVTVTVAQTPTTLRSLSPVVVLPGISRQLSTTVLDAVGAPIADAQVLYSSAVPELSVSPDGLLAALGQPGTFAVTATVGPHQATIQIVVPTHPAGQVVATQNLTLAPWGVGISTRGTAYVTIPASGAPRLERVSLPSFTVTPGPAGTAGGSPLSVAFSWDGAFAYVPWLAPGALTIVDVQLNQVAGSVRDLPAELYGVLLTRNDSTIYVTANNDLMYVIDAATRAVTTTVDLKGVSNYLVQHPSLPHLFASSFNAAKVVEVDEVTYEVLRTLPVGGKPQGLAISPDGTEMYVADELGRLVVWDLQSNALKQEVSVPPGAFGLTLTPDADQIYVTIAGGANGAVQIYDRNSRALIGTINTGGSPRRVAFDITGNLAIVTNDASQVHFIK
jgi:DNA-binding beta-propeller fold protein YncE